MNDELQDLLAAIQDLTTKLHRALKYLETATPGTENREIWDAHIRALEAEIDRLEGKITTALKTHTPGRS